MVAVMNVRVLTLSESDAQAALERAISDSVPRALHPLVSMLEEFNRKAYLLKEFLTPEEASDYVNGYWKPGTIRQYVTRGKLPGTVMGRLVMVHRPGLDDLLREKMRKKSDQKSDFTENETP